MLKKLPKIGHYFYQLNIITTNYILRLNFNIDEKINRTTAYLQSLNVPWKSLPGGNSKFVAYILIKLKQDLIKLLFTLYIIFI